MPPRPRRTVKEVSEELYLAWQHTHVLMDMQIRLLEQLYPNRHNPEHADHAPSRGRAASRSELVHEM